LEKLKANRPFLALGLSVTASFFTGSAASPSLALALALAFGLSAVTASFLSAFSAFGTSSPFSASSLGLALALAFSPLPGSFFAGAAASPSSLGLGFGLALSPAAAGLAAGFATGLVLGLGWSLGAASGAPSAGLALASGCPSFSGFGRSVAMYHLHPTDRGQNGSPRDGAGSGQVHRQN